MVCIRFLMFSKTNAFIYTLLMKITNKKSTADKLEPSEIKKILSVIILINTGILIAIPIHFSLISVTILLTSILAFKQREYQMRSNSFQRSLLLSLVVSILFVFLTYYWISKGPYGCAAFFGEYHPCFSYETLQYPMLELFTTPFVLLLISTPMLKGMSLLKIFRS